MIAAAPPVVPLTRPPHDPLSWLLDERAGWRVGTLTEVEADRPAAELRLGGAGTPRSVTEPSGSLGGLRTPVNVALAPDGGVFLLDREAATLARFDPCECAFEEVPCLGGIGAGAREWREPRAIAICNGNLFVSDTGNQRIGVFALRGFVLRGHWRPADPAIAASWRPAGLAFDVHGVLHVGDPANGAVHRFGPAGRWLGMRDGLGSVRFVAVDCGDRVVVTTDTPDVATAYAPDGAVETVTRPDDLAPAFPPPPFEVDAQGRLWLGPLCRPGDDVCREDRSTAVFDLRGRQLTGNATRPNPPPRYATEGVYLSQALDSELYRCRWHRVVLRGAIPAGTAVRVDTYTSEVALDDATIGGLDDAAWTTRVEIRAEDTRARRPRAEDSRVEDRPAERRLRPQPDRCPRPDMRKAVSRVAEVGDCLVRSAPGRYLWLRLVLTSDGTDTPRLTSVSIEFPRLSLGRYLPAVFAEEPTAADFTDRFLALFDTTLRSIERPIDRLASFFDPLATPAERDPKTGADFLGWLASWIGVTLERHWSEESRRRFLKEAGKLFAIRGTRRALWRQLVLLLDMDPERPDSRSACCPDDRPHARCHAAPSNCAPPPPPVPCAWQPPPLILEHQRLRRWLFLDGGRLGDQARLWGKRIVDRTQLDEGAVLGSTKLVTSQDPDRDPFHRYAHKFTVFVPARYGKCDAHRRALANLLRTGSPVHTHHDVEYVEPRFRIGVQAMLGFDAVVARVPQGVTLNDTPLGRASVLTAPPHEAGGPSFEVGTARIGTTTRLN